MNIIVTDHSVAAYFDAADRSPCTCQPFVFPGAGSCASSTDANPCDGNPYCPSCISEFAVEQGGIRLTPVATGGGDPWAGYFDPFAEGPLALVLSGCGHPTTRIPLGSAAFPTAAVTADIAGGAAHVTWTTDAPTQQAFVTMFGGYSADVCFVTGASQYTFADGQGGISVGVQPVGSRTDLETELGHATIWRVGDGSVQLPTP